MNKKSQWLSIPEFCEYMDIGKNLVYEWMKHPTNPLPAYKPAGGHWRINIKEAEKWLRSFESTLWKGGKV